MTIPNIDSYPVPSADVLPPSRVHWRPERGRAALLIHDMQQYFLRFFDPGAQPLASVLDNIARLRRACDEAAIPVIYTAQPPEQSAHERGLLNDVWGPGITAHPDAHHIVEALAPAADDLVLTKYRYSAFHRTELLAELRKRGRDQLIICGVYAHIGCLLTACDAFMNDIQPFFVADAVADFSRDYHTLAVGYAAERCAVATLTDQVLGWLGNDKGSTSFARAALANVLECREDELVPDENLFDLGLDSIRIMALVERLRARGLHLSFVEVAECRTLRELEQRLAGGQEALA
jgi:bifunctional isochorismate lyase / aryl carrier protein